MRLSYTAATGMRVIGLSRNLARALCLTLRSQVAPASLELDSPSRHVRILSLHALLYKLFIKQRFFMLDFSALMAALYVGLA